MKSVPSAVLSIRGGGAAFMEESLSELKELKN